MVGKWKLWHCQEKFCIVKCFISRKNSKCFCSFANTLIGKVPILGHFIWHLRFGLVFNLTTSSSPSVASVPKVLSLKQSLLPHQHRSVAPSSSVPFAQSSVALFSRISAVQPGRFVQLLRLLAVWPSFLTAARGDQTIHANQPGAARRYMPSSCGQRDDRETEGPGVRWVRSVQ